MEKDKHIVEWVIILTICLFVFFPYEMIYTSYTSLGKLFFAVVIVYATSVDITYGIVACCAVLLFYQMDLYRSFISLHRDTLLKEHMTEMRDSMLEEPAVMKEDDSITDFTSYSRGDSNAYLYSHSTQSSNWYEDSIMGKERNRELKDFFRKEHCDDRGRLLHKGVAVRPEMSDHVFRELKFPGIAKCNPCNSHCNFSIVENRISKEEDLRPRESRDDKADWLGHYIMQPIHSMIEDAVAFKNRFAEYL